MSIGDFEQYMREHALAAALRGGLLVPCPIHEHVLLRRGDEDAERRTYAMAMTDIQEGRVNIDPREFTDAIKEALEIGVAHCDLCENNRR